MATAEYTKLADLCEAYYAAEALDRGEGFTIDVFVDTFCDLLTQASEGELLWVADVLSKHRGG